jgi:ketosteroid isomerase-like protein
VSQENVERVRAGLEHFQRTGEPDWAMVSEDVEIHDHDLLDAPAFSGFDGYSEWIGNWASVFSEFSIEDEEFIDAGDTVVVVFRMRAMGSGSGLSIEREDAMVLQMRDMKLRRIDYYNNRAQALESVGLGG